MPALLTTHGNIVVVRPDGGLDQASPRDRAARGTLARLEGPSAADPFIALVEPSTVAATQAVANWDGGAVTLAAGDDRPSIVRVERDGLRLTAELGGAVSWTDRAPGEWEHFLPLDDATLSALDMFLDNDWVIRSSRTLVHRADVSIEPGFRLQLGILDVPIAAQDFAAASLEPAPFSLLLLRDGWRVEEVRPFRPLVFYAAFRSPAVHAQLFTSLQSLFELGGYEGRIHVFTDLDYGAIRAAVPTIAAAESLTTTAMSPTDFVGYVAAKYAIVECETALQCQPVLYLDPDTVANASLLPLLIDVALADRMVAPVEAHRFRKVSLGRDLIEADGGSAERGFGFNGGTIGIPNLRDWSPTLRLIRRMIGNYLERHGRGALPWVDQEIANYVGEKLGVFDDEPISRYVRVGTAQEADRPGPATGLVHFWATPKGTRHLAMQSYLDRLRTRQRRFEPLPEVSDH